jgi:S1-C subfamily serine protease
MYFIDGQVRITEINKGSPADKAGLKPGDVVLSVGGNFSNNIQRYRELLKAPGKKIQLIILRDGQPREIRLQIQSIL